MTDALELEEAQARILQLARLMPNMEVPLAQAQGRYLAKALVSRRTQPSADLSAMDGYALGPERPSNDQWRLVGESRAGTPFNGELKAGETIRISTGAHIPNGADRVLIQENCKASADIVTLTSDYPDPLRHIRQRGFDFAQGDELIASGTRLSAAHIALAAAGGYSALLIAKPPRVAILDSGDELVADPASASEHQLPASNGFMLEAMLAPLGCESVRLGPVGDDADALAKALEGADEADVLITTGGASVGDHDLMKPALEAWDASLDFWRVAMKPGKPIMVATRTGKRGDQVIFGLPGNPVSAYVTCVLFALPLIRASMGAHAPLPFTMTTQTACDLAPVGPRREFVRAHFDGEHVRLVGSQDSSALAALSQANCLIDRLARAGSVPIGGEVRLILLGDLQAT
jgi:molybdopterin molybdotransferase